MTPISSEESRSETAPTGFRSGSQVPPAALASYWTTGETTQELLGDAGGVAPKHWFSITSFMPGRAI